MRTDVTERVQRNGKEYLRVSNDLTGGGHAVFTILFRKDQNGVFGIAEQSPGTSEQQIVKFPLKLGASWEVLMGKQNNRFSVIGFEDGPTI